MSKSEKTQAQRRNWYAEKTQAQRRNWYATLAFQRPFSSYASEISVSSPPQPASLLYMKAKETSYIYSREYTFA
jgi:hypothetical protein